MKLKPFFVLLIALFLSASAHAQDALTEILRQGLFEEEANLDLQAAMGHYEALIEQSEDQRRVLATAVFRLGECYRKLGRNEDAAKQYQRIVDQFADQETLRKLSEQNLKAIGVTVQDSVAGEEMDPTISEEERQAIAEAAQLVQNSPDLINRATTFANLSSYTRLGAAAHKGYLKLAAFLLENGADPNAYPENGRTALSIAAERGHLAIVKLLVENGVDVNSKGGSDRAPLHETVTRRLPQLTEYLLEQGAEVNAVIDSPGASNQRTALHLAAERGYADLIRILIDHGADVDAREITERTPLILAASEGHVEAMNVLIQAGCEVDAVDDIYDEDRRNRTNRDTSWLYGGTALHYAVAGNHKKAVELLLNHNANTAVKNRAGQLPIHLYQTVEVAKMLLDQKSPVNVVAKTPSKMPVAPPTGKPSQCAPLHLAVHHGIEMVELFLDHDADPSIEDGKGDTALFWAVSLGSAPEIIKRLLDAGANPNKPGSQGFSPLGLGVHLQSIDSVKALLAGGAKPVGKSIGGSVLNRAVKAKNNAMVELLLRAGADPHASQEDEEQPLYQAINDRNIEIAGLLLKHGADPNRKISIYGNALHTLLSASDNAPIFDLLLQAGVDVNIPSARLTPPLILAADNHANSELARKLLIAGAAVNATDSQGNTALHLVTKHGNAESLVSLLLEHGADPNLLNGSGNSSYDLVREYLEQGRSRTHHINYQMLVDLMESHGAVDLSERKSRIEVRWERQDDPADTWTNNCLAFSKSPRIGHQKAIHLREGADPNDYNQFTLLEALNECMTSNAKLQNADLSNIVIQRLYASEPKIEVNLVNLLNNGKPDIQLRWGDVIELKPAKSDVSHSEIARQIQDRLARTVQLQCRGETHPVHLVSALGRDPEDPADYDAEAGVKIASFWLSEVVDHLIPAVFLGANKEETQLYKEVTSMDPISNSFELSEVKILRSDPQGNLATYEWDLLNRHPDDDLWLRDGDVVQLKLKERQRVVLDSQELRREEAEELKRLQFLARNSPDLLDPVRGGESPIHNAAKLGYTAVVEYLIQQGVSVEGNNRRLQKTPLHYAAEHGHKAVAEMLIKNGANVNALGSNNVSPLYLAVKEGHRSVVETLLENGADVNVLSQLNPSDGRFISREDYIAIATPLMVALNDGRNDLAQLLLVHSPDLDAQGYNGMQAVHYAAKGGSADILNELIDRGADVNARDQSGNTPVIHAAAWSEAPLQALIKNGAEVDLRNNQEQTALHQAVEHRQPRLVEILLEAGANPNLVDENGYSPLLLAVSANCIECAEHLLIHHADPNFKSSADPNTSLSLAVARNRLEMASLLLNHNADPNLPIHWLLQVKDTTSLHNAVRNQNKPMIQLLLEHGADPNRMDENGKTPLDYLEEMSKSIPGVTVGRVSSRGSRRSSNQTVEKTDSQELIALLKEHGANEYVSRERFIGLGRNDNEFAGEIFERTQFIESAPTLFEAVALHYGSRNYKMDFPDFKNAFIERLDDDKRSIETIPVDIESRVLSGDCGRDIKLEWGDRIVIPEREHPVDEKWAGLSQPIAMNLAKCLSREIDVLVGNETTKVHVVPNLKFEHQSLKSERSTLNYLELVLPKVRSNQPDLAVSKSFTLKEMVQDCGILKSNSDASQIKLIRRLPDRDEPWIVTVDLNNPASPNPWVQKGDRIEIPDSAR